MGYATDFTDYARWLRQASILPVTSHHDFFGTSIVEAIYLGCAPFLPRRLSYPELIPDELHELCFYKDFDDLVNRLAYAIENPYWEHLPSLRKAMAHFDWKEMGGVYDDTVEQLCQGRQFR